MARYLNHSLMVRGCISSTHLYSIDFMFHVVIQESVSVYLCTFKIDASQILHRGK